jgi:UDPglucose 6-dehydrogenase
MSTKITVVGDGYGGAVVAAGLASVGHQVVGVEADPTALLSLSSGITPYHEPDLNALVIGGLTNGTLRFTGELSPAVEQADVVFIATSTDGPVGQGMPRPAFREMARGVARHLGRRQVLVTNDALPLDGRYWMGRLGAEGGGSGSPSTRGPAALRGLVSNPMTLRAGCAVADFLHPQRVVVGSDDLRALDAVVALYRPLLRQDGRPRIVPLVRTTLATAEVVRYAAATLAEARSGVEEEVARLCDLVGADPEAVGEATGLVARPREDRPVAVVRSGPSGAARRLSTGGDASPVMDDRPDASETWHSVQQHQREYVLAQLLQHLKTFRGTRICILGTSFDCDPADRSDTPVVRRATARLSSGDSPTSVYDPSITVVADVADIRLLPEAVRAATNADAVVLATQWPQFLSSDLAALRRVMRGDFFFDGRNNFDPELVRRAGFRYVGIGRRTGSTATPSMVVRSDALSDTPADALAGPDPVAVGGDLEVG